MSKLNFQQGVALFEMALTSAIILIYFFERLFNLSIRMKKRFLMAFILLNVFFWSFSFIGLPIELPLAAYVRGMTGDLSVVFLLLLWSYFFIPMQIPTPISYQLGLVLVACLFYPCALGWGMIDPYAWGYGSWIFLVTIFLITLCMWLMKWHRLVIIFALAIMAWSFNLHESTNLWDYLLDPFLVSWCLVGMLLRGMKMRFDNVINQSRR